MLNVCKGAACGKYSFLKSKVGGVSILIIFAGTGTMYKNTASMNKSIPNEMGKNMTFLRALMLFKK